MTQEKKLLEKKMLLRPDEAAKILRVSKKSIYRRCKAGLLKTASHNPLRITAKSVREYIGMEEAGN